MPLKLWTPDESFNAAPEWIDENMESVLVMPDSDLVEQLDVLPATGCWQQFCCSQDGPAET